MSQNGAIKGTSDLVLAMQDKAEVAKRRAGRRSIQQLQARLYEKSREGLSTSSGNDQMKSLKVRSNFARDRVIVLGNGELVLHFDGSGLATFPEHLLPLLQAEMRSRPGRYRLEEIPVPSPEPKVVAPVKVEAKVAEQVQEQVKELLSSLKASEETGDAEPVSEEVEKAPEVKKQRRPKRRRTRKKESTEE